MSADKLVTGDEELDRLLRLLGEKVVRKMARKSLGKGLTIVARAIRAAVPEATTAGHSNRSIKKAIGKRNKKNRRRGYHEAKTGIHVGKKKGAPHAHLLALGTAERYAGFSSRSKGKRGEFVRTSGAIAYRGAVAANDFVKRGLAAADGPALQRIGEEFFKELEKEVPKLRKGI